MSVVCPHESKDINIHFLFLAGVGRARGRGQPRQAAGGPGMMAPPAVTRTLGVGRGE